MTTRLTTTQGTEISVSRGNVREVLIRIEDETIIVSITLSNFDLSSLVAILKRESVPFETFVD